MMKSLLFVVGFGMAECLTGNAQTPAPSAVAQPAQKPTIYLEAGKTADAYRNIALNPDAATGANPVVYPHATSNSEYNQQEFAARCAIDGKRRNNDVHGCGSWGPQMQPDIWWRLDFGRPVEIDKVTLFLRAAWKPDDNPHDSYWKEARLEFSDGSKEELALKQDAKGQEFTFTKRTVTWLLLKNLKRAEDKWCALCEFEAWGRDAAKTSAPKK